MNRAAVAALGAIVFSAVASVCAQDAREFFFEGETMFTREQMVRALNRYDIRLDPPIEATTADDAAYFLREFFHNEGFPDAEVEYSMAGGRAVFTITEGPRFQLGVFDFEGSDILEKERMEGIMIAEIRQQTRTPFGRLRYVESAVDSGAEKIRLAYVAAGYLDAKVAATPQFSGMTVNVSVRVEAGMQYVIRGVTLNGGEVTPQAADMAAGYRSKTYRPGDELLARSRVLDQLRKDGFFEAAVTEDTTFNPDDGSVHITLDIRSGARFRFGRITVDGNRRTITSALLRRLGVKPGYYNATALDEGVRRLWFSGAFSDVEVKQTAASDKTVDLHLDVKESSARQVSATIGYGQWYQAFGEATFTDRNFFGTLNRFSLRGFISQRSYGVSSELSDPFFLQRELTATLAGFYTRLEMPAFKTTQYGAGVSLEKKFNATSQTGWRVGYQWKAVTNSTVYAEESLDGAPINYTLGALSFQQTLDHRNDLLSPMKGYFLQWKGDVASQALLGDVSFGRFTGQITWYLPLRKIIPERPFVPFVILNHRAGLMLPYADTRDVPIQERFFLGGPDTVRSFQLDGMAPRDENGQPAGGMAYLLGNAEIQWPLWKAFYIAAFADIGNLAPSLGTLSWDETRVGVGLGGRIYTPLGAIRLDYGHNLIRKDGDPLGAWQFGFGFTF